MYGIVTGNLMEDKRLQKVIDLIRTFKEESAMSLGAPTNNASSGAIAGLPPDFPPVFTKKKRNIYMGIGSRQRWIPKKNTTNK
jgi:hypothetical protein